VANSPVTTVVAELQRKNYRVTLPTEKAMSIKLDSEKIAAFERAIQAMADFRLSFGRDLSANFVAEIYAARELGLEILEGPNEQGYDAIGGSLRYQVKHRNAQNVDLNNFNFDFLVLVNLDDSYKLTGMCRMPVDKAKTLFVWREKFRKYQATQDKVKVHSERLDSSSVQHRNSGLTRR